MYMSDSFYLYFMSRVVSVHIVILVVLVLSISKKIQVLFGVVLSESVDEK